MSRKLATIRKISNIQPIEGADNIEVATVNGWKVVVKKGEYKVGDRAVYCEIDSFLPIEPEFEFLRKSSYRKMSDETEGFRLKTMRMMNQVSQGLLISIEDAEKIAVRQSIPSDEVNWSMTSFYEIKLGADISNLLGIVKYDPPLPAQLAGKAKGYFPSFIPKTDEERVQNLENYDEIRNSDRRFYATEKLDGSSATFYIKDGEFGVCSRNLELLEDDTNSFWRVAREMELEEKMKSTLGNFAFQGELIGEGIQKNPYKIKGQTVRFFSVFDIDHQVRISIEHIGDMIKSLGLEMVPVFSDFELPETVDELLEMAEGKSVLNKNTEREGIVIRSDDQEISFKVISNKFLLKKTEK